uniref:Fibrinogen C domain containing 1 n=1 Tax=Xiphophorus maculatus TaxID=8083 RepID=M4A0U8_XIPMA
MHLSSLLEHLCLRLHLHLPLSWQQGRGLHASHLCRLFRVRRPGDHLPRGGWRAGQCLPGPRLSGSEPGLPAAGGAARLAAARADQSQRRRPQERGGRPEAGGRPEGACRPHPQPEAGGRVAEEGPRCSGPAHGPPAERAEPHHPGRPRDCSDVLASGVSVDGVYSVFPTHDPEGFMVYCDLSTDGGGWTVIQRREDGSMNFFRGWEAYRDGFGTTTGEHWLGGPGLHRIYTLTRSGGYELRIDMADFDNATAFACYSDFSVGRDSVNPEEDGYPLTVDGYSGTAGDSLLKHSGMRFTTKDRDQDQSENNCAAYYQGAWWYRNCHTSNLNGQYLRGGHASYADGVEWSSWTGWQYSLRFTEMKIRPRRPES